MNKIKVPKDRKPKVVFYSDVVGWAWHNKSKFLKDYLSDEYDIDIAFALNPSAGVGLYNGSHDLYFTYGYSYVGDMLRLKIPRDRIVTGVTAHRPTGVIKPQMKKAGHLHANSIMLKLELEG